MAARAKKSIKPRTKAQRTPKRYLQSSISIIEGSGQHGAKQRPFSYDAAVRQFHSWAYSAASMNANAVASNPLRLYVKSRSTGTRLYRTRDVPSSRKRYLSGDLAHKPGAYVLKAFGDRTDYEEVVEHPILDLLQSVNLYENGYNSAFLRVIYQQLTGNAYLHPVIGEMGVPAELWTMPSQWMWIVPDRSKFLKGYVYGSNIQNPQMTFEPDEVIHFKYPNPRNLFYGLGKVEACWTQLAITGSKAQMDLATFDNMARPDYLVAVKGGTTQEALDRFEASVAARFRGVKNAGKMLPVSGDVSVVPLNWNPKDLGDTAQVVEVIASVFGVPVSKLKANQNVAGGQAEVSDGSYMKDTVHPLCVQDAEVLNSNLLSMFDIGEESVLCYDDCIPKDQKFEVDKNVQYVGAGILLINEAREGLGLEPIEGGDVPRINGQSLEQLDNPPDPLGGFGTMPDDDGGGGGKSYGRGIRHTDWLGDEGRGTLHRVTSNRQGHAAGAKVCCSCGQMHDGTKGGLGGEAGVHSGDRISGERDDDHGRDDDTGGVDGNQRENTDNAKSSARDSASRGVARQIGGNAGGFGIAAQHLHHHANRPELSGPAVRGRAADFGSSGISQTAALHKAWEGVEDGKCGPHCDRDGDRRGTDGRDDSDSGVLARIKACQEIHLKEAQEDLPDSGSIRGFSSNMNKTLRAQVNEAVKAMTAQGIAPATAMQLALQVIADPKWIEQITEAARPFLERAIEIGGNFGAEKLSQRLPSAIGFDVTNPKVQEFVNSYSVRLAKGVNQFTEVSARRLLGAGLEKGESIPELVERVQDWAGQVGDTARGTAARAENIARTESARAYVKGEQAAWQQSGVVQGKSWLLAGEAACEFCEAAAAEFENRNVSLNSDFYTRGHVLKGTQGGEMVLDYDDIDGPPLHPQCRCDLIPVLMELDQ